MNEIYLMAVILAALALAQTWTAILAYRAGSRWPLVVWLLLIGVVVVDALVLKSKGIGFWISLFWNGGSGDANWFDDSGFAVHKFFLR